MTKRVGITYSDEIKVEPYAQALREAGVEPVLITPGREVALDNLDGLLLSGGVDVNPARYGQEKQPETEDPNDARDEMEARLLEEALSQDMPVLAICRGMQLFNVAHGGTLHQHVTGHQKKTGAQPVHQVSVEAGSRLAGVVGADPLPVNSRHHQVVDQLGDGLVVTARGDDGTVEALERPDKRFAVAVQWHPEDQAPVDARQAAIFRKFAETL